MILLQILNGCGGNSDTSDTLEEIETWGDIRDAASIRDAAYKTDF
tara:strand:+ start:480 stop:614 length:135 start_codon:yes stop_codon:yes gene_type:complete